MTISVGMNWALRKLRSISYDLGPPLIATVVILVVWEAAVAVFDVHAIVLPPPTAILEAGIEHWRALVDGFWVTLFETALGFLLAVLIGMPLAILMIYSKLMSRTLYPLLVLAQSVPKVAVAPLVLIWLGYGLEPKIVIALLVAFFPIFVDTTTGLRSIDPNMLQLTRCLRATEWQTFWKIRMPAALPHVFSGFKVAVTLAVIGAVIGEFVGATDGLGYIVVQSAAQSNSALAWAALTLLGVIGVGLFGLIALAEAIFIPWAHGEAD